ncbi:surface glycoprotein [Natrinema thermotolerans]|uniref:Surface glycoprotein n=1 Tax=Natrinema thermotolerans TaxID=121872 RepID=A0AAF0PEX8_9EURY|nr:surface glycoprotein [Natrinema thermotolerans]WMT09895.1 surface glycoprotein [Natrinema thermotolerans]
MLEQRLWPGMDKNQLIAVVFALLMVTSMVAWGATAIF